MALVVGTNAYLAVADATAYFADRLHSAAWTSASEADKAAALVTASRAVDGLPLQGRVVLTSQAMAFPRLMWTSNNDALSGTYGVASAFYDEGQVYPCWVDIGTPQAVKDATCEEALFLLELTDADYERQRLQAQGIVGRGAGDGNEYAQQSFVQQRATGAQGLWSSTARRLMARYTSGTVRTR